LTTAATTTADSATFNFILKRYYLYLRTFLHIGVGLFFLLERDFLVGTALDNLARPMPKSKRRRFRRAERQASGCATSLKSCYQFKNWFITSTGERVAVALARRESADLISTYYFNPATGTKTVHSLAFDLDFDRADAKWQRDGRLDWGLIGNFLKENEKPIFTAITYVASSTSGQGLGVAISISPLEISERSENVQLGALILQSHIIKILNSYGMGADPGARGIMRDMPNWLNPNKLIDYNDIQKAQVDNGRIPIVTQLLSYTNDHPAIRYVKKSEAAGFLWPNIAVEAKLARFYLALLDEPGDAFFSFSALRAATSLCKATLYKLVNNPPAWLKVERINKYEGYRLTLTPSPQYSMRAHALVSGASLEGGPFGEAGSLRYEFSTVDLKRPEEVQDGERNGYITTLALTLKHAGVAKGEAEAMVKKMIGEIPGAQYSRNCRSSGSIVSSIYKNKPALFGIRSGCYIPSWLLGNNKTVVIKIECPTFFKKGIGDPCVCGCDDTSFATAYLNDFPKKNYSGGAGDLPPRDLTAASKILPLGRRGASEMGAAAGSGALGLLAAFAPKAAAAILAGKSAPAAAKALPTKEGAYLIVAPEAKRAAAKPAHCPPRLSEKRRANFSNVHPIDRFLSSFERLSRRYNARAIGGWLERVHEETGSRVIEKKASEYLPSRHPFRRITTAFLLMSHVLRGDVLKSIKEE
jgi:hypothetical protein